MSRWIADDIMQWRSILTHNAITPVNHMVRDAFLSALDEIERLRAERPSTVYTGPGSDPTHPPADWYS